MFSFEIEKILVCFWFGFDEKILNVIWFGLVLNRIRFVFIPFGLVSKHHYLLSHLHISCSHQIEFLISYMSDIENKNNLDHLLIKIHSEIPTLCHSFGYHYQNTLFRRTIVHDMSKVRALCLWLLGRM